MSDPGKVCRPSTSHQIGRLAEAPTRRTPEGSRASRVFPERYGLQSHLGRDDYTVGDLAEHSAVRRPIFRDDVDGTLPIAYGLLPNMTWIIGRGGKILYKAAWTAADDVADALDAILDGLDRQRSEPIVPMYTERMAWRESDPAGFHAGLERAGPRAVQDFYGTS